MRTRERRRLVSIVGAVVVAVGVAVTVLIAGMPRTPALLTLTEDPDPAPDDGIVFLRDDGDESCVVVVRDGRERLGDCVDDHPRLAVDAHGEVTLRRRLDGVEVVSDVDPETGELGDRRAAQPGDRDGGPTAGDESDAGHRAFTERRHDVLVVAVAEPGGDIHDLAEVRADEDYHLRDPAWSPDGRWLVLVDSSDRLLLVDAEGDAPVRVLAEDVSHPVWIPST